MTEHEAIKEAIRLSGRSTSVAEALGITPQAVRAWDRCPAERVLVMERLCGGAVTRHQLRPDLYPIEDPAEAS
jgi:DNA-binding transcriptional regulator YdaS (Cro superfamily)